MPFLKLTHRDPGIRAWVAFWFLAYTFLHLILRLLIGKERRDRVISLLGLMFDYRYDVRYGLAVRYEPEVCRVLRKVFGSGARFFIDVGAYHGFFSIYAYRLMKSREGKILAVEAEPNNFRMLLRTIPDDGLIEAVNVAVWVEDCKKIDFLLGKEKEGFSMTGSISPPSFHFSRGWLSGRTIQVNTVRLDTLINRFGFTHVDLVKMDIEGAEYHVLTDHSLDLSKVRNIVVSVHYETRSRESREIILALRKKGFRTIPLSKKSPWPVYHLIACRDEIPW